MDPERIRQIEAELENISALTDERVAELRTELVELLREIAAETPTVESVAAMHALDEHLTQIATVVDERAEGAAALEAEVAEIAARVLGEPEVAEDPDPEPAPADPDPEPEVPAPAEAEVAPEPVAVAASARRPSLGEIAARRPARHAPSPATAPRGPRLRVTSEGLDRPLGGDFDSWEGVVTAFARKHDAIASSDARSGEFSGVVQIDVKDLYGPGRRLENDGTGFENAQIVAHAYGAPSLDEFFRTGPEVALTASGGLCAPVDSYYGQLHVGDAGRPIKASLPSFQANRGGIRFVPPVSLSTITNDQAGAAITTITMAQDATSKAKTKQTVTCPAIQEVDFTALAYRLGFGNVGARTFPERVRNILEVTMDQFARVAERRLLTQIAAGSKTVTTTGVYGATRDLIGAINRAAAGYRNRNRMSPDAQLRVIMPAWIQDLITADLANQAPGDGMEHFSISDGTIIGWLQNANISITFAREGEAATGLAVAQDWAAQAGLSAGLQDFPDNMVWYMFAEGTWLYLDGGTLDLGLVRDSTLNSTNDYEVMAEIFEDVANVGVESLRIISPICANGTYPLGVAAKLCTGVGFGS